MMFVEWKEERVTPTGGSTILCAWVLDCRKREPLAQCQLLSISASGVCVNIVSCLKPLQRKLLSHDELKEILSPLRALVRAFYQSRAKVTKTHFSSQSLAKGTSAHTCCLSEWRESSSGLQRNSRTWPKVTAKIILPCWQFSLSCDKHRPVQCCPS